MPLEIPYPQTTCFGFCGVAHRVTLNGLETQIWFPWKLGNSCQSFSLKNQKSVISSKSFAGFDTFPKIETIANLLFQVPKLIVTRDNFIKPINLTSSSGGKFNLRIGKSSNNFPLVECSTKSLYWSWLLDIPSNLVRVNFSENVKSFKPYLQKWRGQKCIKSKSFFSNLSKNCFFKECRWCTYY